MDRRKTLREELVKIMEYNYTGDPHQNQMKRLEVINATALLEVIKTLDKIDKNNQKLSKISENLGSTSNKIQRWVLWLTVGLFILAAVTLVVAVKAR